MVPRFLVRVILLLSLCVLPCLGVDMKVLRQMPRHIWFSPLVEGPDGALYGVRALPRIGEESLFRVTRNGREFRGIPCPPELVPSVFTFGEDGDIYGANNNVIVRISPSGSARILYALPQAFPSYPVDIVRAPDGTIYGATNHGGPERKGSIFRIHRDGSVDEIPLSGNGPSGIVSLAMGNDGALWGAAQSGGSARAAFFRMTPDGTVTNPVANLPLDSGKEVLAHPDGNHYVFSALPSNNPSANYTLIRIAPDGTATRVKDLLLHNMTIYTRIALGRDGHFYSPQHDTLVRISTAGEVAHLSFKMPKGYSRPSAITLAHDGHFYGVLEGFRYGRLLVRLDEGEQGAINLPPVARDDFATPPAPGKSRVIPVLANDTDANRDALSLTTVNAPALGSASIDSTGRRIIYTAPLAESLLADEVTYEITDGAGGVATGRVAIRRIVRGTFSELLVDSDPKHDGYIQVTLSGPGRLTGTLWLGGIRWPISGALDLNGRASITLPGFGAPVLDLSIEIVNGEPLIGVNIEYDGVTTTRQLSIPNSAAGRQKAGSYTWIIPPRAEWLDEPARLPRVDGGTTPNPLYKAAGYGFGSLIIAPNGRARVVGQLPNDRPIAAANALDAAGHLSLFAAYNRYTFANAGSGGWVRGKVLLRDREDISDADGTLLWRMPHPFVSAGYTAPMKETPLAFLASRYTPAATLPEALGMNGSNSPRFTAAAGDLAAPVTVDLSANRAQFFATASGNLSLAGALNSATGTLSGSVRPSGWSISTRFRGVIFQKQASAFGQFDSFSVHPGTGAFEIRP